MTAGGRDHRRTGIDGEVDRRLADRRRRPPDQDRLRRLDRQVPVKRHPGGGVDLRDCRQLWPAQTRIDCDDIAGGHGHELGIAAVALAREAADQRHDGRSRRELTAAILLHGPDGFDPEHADPERPHPASHVRVGVVEPKCPDANQHLAVGRDRVGQFLDRENVGSAVLGHHYRLHGWCLLSPAARPELLFSDRSKTCRKEATSRSPG